MKCLGLAALALAAALCALICGCGDTFRPVATPLPQPSPTPQTARFAVFTSCVIDASTHGCSSSSTTPGVTTDVDISGDTIAGVTTVGRSPIDVLVESLLVVTADRDSDSVTSYSHIAIGTTTTISGTATTGLPSGALPTSLVNANGIVYVTESGRNVVAVLGGSPLSISAEIPVGVNPTNLTVLPNGKKIYVVNAGDNSVTVVDTSDNSIVTTISNTSDPLAQFSHPVWAVPSADSSHVFVVNQGNSSVTVIDATADRAIKNLPVGSSPTYAILDPQNQRVVTTNPGSGTSAGSISVINADPTSPLFETVTNVVVGINPTSVTALANGTRLYVANTGSHSVSVVNSLSLTVSKTISLITAADPTPSPVSIASDAESATVLIANRDSQDVSVINTATDTELTGPSGKIVRIPAPLDPTCASTTPTSCGKLSPVFVSVGPG